MKVAEWKNILPLADVYEIDEDKRYLLVVSVNAFPPDAIEKLRKILPLGSLVMTVAGDPSKVVSMKGPK